MPTGIFFNVNGRDIHEENVDPELTLAYYLRNKLGLRGTKLGCEEGVCGSCTVVIGTWDDGENKAVYRAVNACLVPLFHVHRTFVITVEGVGSREKITRFMIEWQEDMRCNTYVDSGDLVILKGDRVELAIPKTLEQFKSARADRNVISSGLITRFVTSRNPAGFSQKWITTRYVKEFNEINMSQESIEIGAAVSIQRLADTLSANLSDNIAPEVAAFIQKFSSPQIANFATWSGAIVSAAKSSISVSDVLLLLNVLEAQLTVLFSDGSLQQIPIEKYPLDKLYETGTIVNVQISRNDTRRLFCLKLGETSEEDSTNFNFAALIGDKKQESRIFVGLGGQPKRLKELEKYVDSGDSYELEEMYKVSGLERNNNSAVALTRLMSFLKDGRKVEAKENVNYLQYFKPTTNESAGRPIANYFNQRAITGEAIYVNDIQAYNAVHLGFVLSTVPHGEILNIDYSEALKLEGVAGYFGVSDVLGNNKPGLQQANMNFPDDTTVFAEGKVSIEYGLQTTKNNKNNVQVECVGQVIGVIAANDVVLARRAAKLVKVEYKKLKPLTDFKEARNAESYLGPVQHFGKDEKILKEALEKSNKVLEGEVSVGGQEHYYLETQSSLVVPGEGDELVVHCSTQGTSFTQLMVAEFMKVPAHKVIVKTKRLGGGFGGKVNNASWIACMCSVVARKLNRPTYGFSQELMTWLSLENGMECMPSIS
ncbi:hypothetical protein CRE_26880, partial [Caenorhabditis remanei]